MKISKRKPTICEDTGEIAKTYGDYLKTKHWRTFRKQILIDRKYTCEKCKRDLTHNSSLLHVHHTTYTNIGHENKEDVLLLCKDCHRDIHSIINSKKTKNKANNNGCLLLTAVYFIQVQTRRYIADNRYLFAR